MPFPIYSHLVKDGRLIARPDDQPFHTVMKPQFKRCALVQGIDPDPAAEIYSFEDIAVVEQALDKLGPLTPAFEEMWIEYDFARIVGPPLDSPDSPVAVGGAAFVIHHRDPVIDDNANYSMDNLVEIAAYIRYKNNVHVHCSIGMAIELNPDGSRHRTTFGVRDPKLEYLFSDEVEWRTAWMIIYPILYTIGLMNCKNVGLEKHSYRSRSSSAKARKREPKLEYHTIVLPKSKAQRGDSQGGEHSTPAIHKVRGHFKTYTAERPLLGKHVGTYWWPWQVRGDADKGAVISKYEVREPE